MKFLGFAIVALVIASSAAAGGTVTAACTPNATVLKSPRANSVEVQVKALNDRGDAVGFADAGDGTREHAILWKAGGAAFDLGVLPGYAASEAYGINDAGVVFGLLYDRRDRTYPFRWQHGRMTLLKGPNGRVIEASGNPGSGGRNAVNAKGEMAWTLMVGGNPRAVRWSASGTATLLPRLAGHKWSWAFGINDRGIVSGWSRRLPSEDGEENPVLWTVEGNVVPLETVQGQADGIAEATNRAGLSVGYLGNLGTDADPEHDQFAVWKGKTDAPLLIGPVRDNLIAEFVDVNDRGQAAGMTGILDPQTGFPTTSAAVIWQLGWTNTTQLTVPAAARKHPVRVVNLNDVNNRGAVVGNVYGLAAKDFSALRGIYPVVWKCAFGR